MHTVTHKNIPYQILLIQTDEKVAKCIIEWLSEYAKITHVSDEINAIKNTLLDKWNLVISDFNSLTLNDLEITKLVKQTNPETPILIVTADQKVDFIITALQSHADGFFFKPLEKEKFLEQALQLAKKAQAKPPKPRKVILAIGAHPDDVEIGCGGSLAMHYANGDALNILTLSSGGAGGNATVRKAEARTAAKLQKAKLFLGTLTDTKISETVHTIKLIDKIVTSVKPTHIYTHSIHDGHQDHRNVYYATIAACREIPNLYCYQAPSSSVEFQPNLFIDITAFIQQKLDAIAVYRSQSIKRPYLEQDLVHSTARYWVDFVIIGWRNQWKLLDSNIPNATVSFPPSELSFPPSKLSFPPSKLSFPPSELSFPRRRETIHSCGIMPNLWMVPRLRGDDINDTSP